MAPGQGYGRLRAAFTDLLSDRWYALLVSTKYLGGATTARDHRGDPDARPALTPSPRTGSARPSPSSPTQASASAPFTFRPSCSSRLGARALAALGRSPRRDGTGRLPAARLGAGAAGLSARPAARSRGALPDPRRRASRAARRADGRHPRALRTLTTVDLGRAGHPARREGRAAPATSRRCGATFSGCT